MARENKKLPDDGSRDWQRIALHYRQMIEDMQGHVFFCQDDEGALRRWTPPKRSMLDTET